MEEKIENKEYQNYFERLPSDYDNWFKKHSINNNKNNESDKVKLEEDNKISYNNPNIDNNSNKNIDFNYESGRKYNLINCTLNECQNNFVSIIKCHNDHLLFLDNTNKIIVVLIEKKDGNIERLKFIQSFEFYNVI